MSLHSNHDDQKRVVAPSTHLAPQLLAGDSLTQPDPLSAHLSCLEVVLDSALATLTLIRDYTPTGPVLTFHTAEVLRALCRHAPAPEPVQAPIPDTMLLTPTQSVSPTPVPAPASATYAEAVSCTASDLAVTATSDKPALSDPRDKPTLKDLRPNSRIPDLIFLFGTLRGA
ncbi:hypothetical protein K438DRAFT_1997453 [Mycena galopus ATCC 62051]|nr:hypothetical protein K438DRAFT_1997453 [Mycena galopus ATCC 62051]